MKSARYWEFAARNMAEKEPSKYSSAIHDPVTRKGGIATMSKHIMVDFHERR